VLKKGRKSEKHGEGTEIVDVKSEKTTKYYTKTAGVVTLLRVVVSELAPAQVRECAKCTISARKFSKEDE